MDLKQLVQDFTDKISAAVDASVAERLQAVLSDLGGGKRGPGRPSNGFSFTARKKPPKQFCPVPGCKNAAAPIFGMVCSDHKDLPKAKVKQYREARRAAKVKSEGKEPKKAKAKTPKKAKAKAKAPKKAKAKAPKKAKAKAPKAAKAETKATKKAKAETKAPKAAKPETKATEETKAA